MQLKHPVVISGSEREKKVNFAKNSQQDTNTEAILMEELIKYGKKGSWFGLGKNITQKSNNYFKNSEKVIEVHKKLKKYDKALFIKRIFIRLFSDIEKQRILLCYYSSSQLLMMKNTSNEDNHPTEIKKLLNEHHYCSILIEHAPRVKTGFKNLLLRINRWYGAKIISCMWYTDQTINQSEENNQILSAFHVSPKKVSDISIVELVCDSASKIETEAKDRENSDKNNSSGGLISQPGIEEIKFDFITFFDRKLRSDYFQLIEYLQYSKNELIKVKKEIHKKKYPKILKDLKKYLLELSFKYHSDKISYTRLSANELEKANEFNKKILNIKSLIESLIQTPLEDDITNIANFIFTFETIDFFIKRLQEDQKLWDSLHEYFNNHELFEQLHNSIMEKFEKYATTVFLPNLSLEERLRQLQEIIDEVDKSQELFRYSFNKVNTDPEIIAEIWQADKEYKQEYQEWKQQEFDVWVRKEIEALVIKMKEKYLHSNYERDKFDSESSANSHVKHDIIQKTSNMHRTPVKQWNLHNRLQYVTRIYANDWTRTRKLAFFTAPTLLPSWMESQLKMIEGIIFDKDKNKIIKFVKTQTKPDADQSPTV